MYPYTKRKPQGNLRKKFLYIALLSVIPFILIAGLSFSYGEAITTMDYEVGSFFYELREPLRTMIATGITRIADLEGQVLITIVVVILLFLFRKWRTALWYGLTVLIGAAFINGAVKNLFQRIRPDQIDHLIEQGGYAFPSGHAMGSMIVFGGILFIIIRLMTARRVQSQAAKGAISFLIGLLILFIGLSRIYLGVHYPSDVIGGFSLGFAWLSLSIATLGLSVTEKEFRAKRKYKLKTK